MNLEEICDGDRYEYNAICDVCEQNMSCMTQEDRRPEYYTDVYFQCNCGNYIKFILPVN